MELNTTLLFSGLGIGLLSSFTHCAGMCGPIQMLLRRAGTWGALAFHTGRITGYSVLGALIAGLLSGVMSLLRGEMGWTLKIAMVSFYLIAGIVLWFGLPWIEKSLGRFFPMTRIVALMSKGQGLMLLPAGLLMSMLPCPTTITALALALSSADAVQGFGTMFFFGLGTLPALVILERLGALKWLRRSHLATRIVAIYFLGSGIFQAAMMITHHRPCCH